MFIKYYFNHSPMRRSFLVSLVIGEAENDYIWSLRKIKKYECDVLIIYKSWKLLVSIRNQKYEQLLFTAKNVVKEQSTNPKPDNRNSFCDRWIIRITAFCFFIDISYHNEL